jgi:hypothetical protein
MSWNSRYILRSDGCIIRLGASIFAEIIIACVAVPHHCPCPFPTVEDKFELGEGSAICVSKGGFKAGEAARKVELARKGLI